MGDQDARQHQTFTFQCIIDHRRIPRIDDECLRAVFTCDQPDVIVGKCGEGADIQHGLLFQYA